PGFSLPLAVRSDMPAMLRRVAVLAGLFLIVASPPAGAGDSPPVPAFTPDPVTVQRFGPGYRYPQAGWIVLHIEGAPYERGFQHGRLMAAEIVDFIQTLAIYRCPKSPADGWRELRLLANALFLRRFEPEYLEEMK